MAEEIDTSSKGGGRDIPEHYLRSHLHLERQDMAKAPEAWLLDYVLQWQRQW